MGPSFGLGCHADLGGVGQRRQEKTAPLKLFESETPLLMVAVIPRLNQFAASGEIVCGQYATNYVNTGSGDQVIRENRGEPEHRKHRQRNFAIA